MNSRDVVLNAHGNGHESLAARVVHPGRKRDRAAKQRALIRAATELFASRGYEATTTREIAARAGCAEGLIHRYFQGKAGLLSALMRFHASLEAAELSKHLPRADDLDQEIQQLVEWELDRMWKARDFLRVTIPRAILDPKVGQFVSKVGPGRHAKAICERLRHYQRNGAVLEDSEVEALANAIGALGFTFGFMRQVVFGFDRKQTKGLAVRVAKIFSRGLQYAS
jgi:AcrR family transcriptional regulator